MNAAGRAAIAIAVAALGAGAAWAQSGTVAPSSAPADPARLRAEPVPPAVDAAFRAWDANRDGSLSLAEFRDGWRSLRRHPDRRTVAAGLRRQFERLDGNHDGGIDRTEYPDMALVERAGTRAPPFAEVDGDGNQTLDFTEYTHAVRRLRTAADQPGARRE